MEILYQDDWLVVLAKPSGLLVHRGWGDDDLVAVTRARQATGRFVHPVHRLDRGASGALLMTFDAQTAAALHTAFEDGRVDKQYLALVRGVAPERVTIDHPIPRRQDGPRVPAVTEVRRLTSDGAYSWVAARPFSGRMHQVRRHLKHIAHPVIGDANYGKGQHNRAWRERGLNRLALHASSLRFVHPATGVEVLVEAPLPGDLAVPLARAGFIAPAAPSSA